jgi:hypothetical protein
MGESQEVTTMNSTIASVGLFGWMLLAAACGGSPSSGGEGAGTGTGGTTPTSARTVADVITSGSTMPVPPSTGLVQKGSPAPEAQPETYPDGSQWQCTVTNYSLQDDPEDFVTLSPNAAVIWPGSMLQGNSVESGSPEPIAVKRGGGTIVMNLLNAGKGVQANSYQMTLNEITQGNVIDAQNKILSNNVGGTPAAFSFESQKIDSTTQMALDMNVNVSWESGDVSAALSFDTDSHYTRYLVKLTQQYYTMVFQTPTSPTDLLDPSVTPEELATYVGPGNPATYISSITYGRQFYLLMESTASEQDMSAALSATYNGGFANLTGNAKASFDQTESETTIKAYAVGGGADTTLQGVLQAASGKGFEALFNFLQQGSTFGPDNPGVPISYVVRNAVDNGEVHVALAGDYATKQCYPIVSTGDNLVLWVDANDIAGSDGQTFTTWKGRSTNANSPQNGQGTYAAKGINGHPSAFFTGTNGPGGGPGQFDIDLGSGYVAGTDYTIVAAVRGAGSDILTTPIESYFLTGQNMNWATDSNLHLGWDNPSELRFGQFDDDVVASELPQTTGDIVTARESLSSGKWLYMDGVLRQAEPSQTTQMVNNPGARIGGGSSFPNDCVQDLGGNVIPGTCVTHWYYGHVGEIRVYDYALKDSERLSVECQMGAKWDIPVAGCVNGAPDPTVESY